MGFRLLEEAGYSTGGTLGKTQRKTAIATPVDSSTPQEELVPLRAIRDRVRDVDNRQSLPSVQVVASAFGPLERFTHIHISGNVSAAYPWHNASHASKQRGTAFTYSHAIMDANGCVPHVGQPAPGNNKHGPHGLSVAVRAGQTL